MTLPSGSRLGSFEILAPLGAGGMGEVYRARDTRLEREVAIKVLPAELAADPGRLRRFESEARGASSLNHPSIVTIYEIGTENRAPFIVMELVAGSTLREVLQSGPLPGKRLLELASRIADGLAAAHEAEIVHRDLKPDNIMVTRDGLVKILDFGLAKLARKSLGEGEAHQATRTEPGELLGTVGYMSPEQAAGQPADFRSDQFSFGSMLYEMATGRKAFHGLTVVDTLSAILHEEPEPVASRRLELPESFSWIVERCLAKEPAGRYQSTVDLARDLATVRDRATSAVGLVTAKLRPPKSGGRRIVLSALLATAVLLVASLLSLLRQPRLATEARRARFSVALPTGARMVNLIDAVARHDLAVSPGGEQIAFVAFSGGLSRLWVRSLDSLSPRALAGTEGAKSPFWSPGGDSLAFFADGKLKRIAVAGGPAQTLCPVSNDHVTGSWSTNGTILVAEGPLWSGRSLDAIASSGGELRRVSEGASWQAWDGFNWPHFLPDGRHFLVLARGGPDEVNYLLAGSIDGPEVQQLSPFDSRFELGAGQLFYVREGTLYAQPFDLPRLRFGGEAVPLVEEIPYFAGSGWAPFSASKNGVLAYQAGRVATPLRWLDRAGSVVGTVGAPAYYGSLRLSPDGRNAVVERMIPSSGFADLWIEELERAIETRFTSGGTNGPPIWSPDGKAVLYVVSGEVRIKRLGEVGAGRLVPLGTNCDFPRPADWSPDGRSLLFSASCPETRSDLWLLPLEGDREPTPFRQTEFSEGEGGAAFSPDGGWIAYLSDESGRFELYLSPVSGRGQTRVSVAGAALQPPRFRRDGGEIFYLGADHRLVAVPLTGRGETMEPGSPVPLFAAEMEIWNSYDVTADGERLLLNPGTQWDISPITVVLAAER